MELDKATSILKLEEFNAPESVKPYNGQEIYLRTEDVKNGPHTDQNTEKLHGLEGFILVDLNTDLKAEIVAIEEFPQQLMATVVVEGNEYFVPLVEELIEEINAENKTISMHLPEGLFEA
jgi:16S rRNA processing protein RimM